MLKDNPFHVIGAELSDSKRKILQLAEEAELLYDDELVNKAKDVLLQPSTRVSALLQWLPGFDSGKRKELFSIIEALNGSKSVATILPKIDTFFKEHDEACVIDGYFEKEEGKVYFQSYNLEYINILLEVMSKANSLEYWELDSSNEESPEVELISDYIKHISVCLKMLDIEGVITVINDKSSGSGFSLENGSQLVLDAFTEYKNKILKTIEEFLENLPGDISAQVYQYLIADVTNEGTSYDYGLELVEQLYNNYKIGIYQYLQDEKSNIVNALNKIGEVLDKSGAYDNFETHMEKIHDLIDSWMDIYQPIYYFESLENPQKSKNELLEVLFMARLVYVKYYNAKGNETIVEDGLKNLLESNLNEMSEFDEAIENDLLQIKRNRLDPGKASISEKASSSASSKEITYFNSAVGLLGNTVLRITNKYISWGNTKIRTEDVLSLNWGQIINQVFLFFTSTDSRITIKSQDITINLRPRTKYYNQIVDALLKAAGYRLCNELFAGISGGGSVKLVNKHGSFIAYLKDDGVILSKFSWSKSDEYIFFPWKDVRVGALDGRVHIVTIGSKLDASLSFIDDDNAPIVFIVLKTFYDKRRFSDDKVSDVFYREFNQ